jgi:hypothetical protein
MIDEFGRIGWFHPGQVVWMPPERKAKLSERQLKRIAQIHDVFSGLDLDLTTGQPMTLQRQIELFSCEGAFIEEEISLWEHFVDVFQKELAERRDNSSYLQSFVYCAIRTCFEALSLGDALSAYPILKTLPDLERVFARVHAQLVKTEESGAARAPR